MKYVLVLSRTATALSASFPVRGESLPRSVPRSSRGVLRQTIFGGQVTSAAESGHVTGIAISGALLFLQRRHS